jgi:hypothetical protein
MVVAAAQGAPRVPSDAQDHRGDRKGDERIGERKAGATTTALATTPRLT